eukprot:gene9574-12897_t
MIKSKIFWPLCFGWICLITFQKYHITGIQYNHSVKVFHFLVDHWGTSKNGIHECNNNVRCEWFYSDHIRTLKDNLYLTPTEITFNSQNNSYSSVADTDTANYNVSIPTTTLSLYNIHSWWEKTRDTKPVICELHTNLTMAESEESKVRYAQLFDQSFKNFDGYSTTHSLSSVQRVYSDAYLNSSHFLPMKNFSSLIKGASYVASDCHKRDSANANRDSVVHMIKTNDFRVDGLGRCMHTPTGPEGIVLGKTRDSLYNLYLKRLAISNYMFNLAFENSFEPGYVTEKPFDSLISGTVPVYLGDADHLKTLIPHPKAVIFVADYHDNYTALVEYLKYLENNETAYEEHRSWRNNFNYQENVHNKPLLNSSWFCRVCDWAVEAARIHHKRPRLCPTHNNTLSTAAPLFIKTPNDWNGKAVRGKSRQIYYVKNSILHPVPDLPTFFSLKLTLESVMVVDDMELLKYYISEPLPRVAS